MLIVLELGRRRPPITTACVPDLPRYRRSPFYRCVLRPEEIFGLLGSNRRRMDPLPKIEEKTIDPWVELAKIGSRYDKERCDRWRDEIDNILIFVCALFH